jgi:prepilin-type N-terminal cleavage/methylation domain-containing protein
MRMIPARRLLADERGFSLMELVVAMAIGSIVLTTLLGVFMNGMSNTTGVTDRIEATQRARIATDRVTTLLQAQVCVDGASPISDAQATTVTFTANIGDVLADPVRYTFRYDTASKTLWEDDFLPTMVNGTPTYAAPPSRSRVLISNVEPVNVTPFNGAFFTYYAFDATTGLVDDNAPLFAPLTNSDEQRVVRVGTGMVALPERTKANADPRATTITGQAIVGSADPANPDKGPKC